MTTLKTVMTIQAIILFVYGLPYLLVPRWTTAITQQATLQRTTSCAPSGFRWSSWASWSSVSSATSTDTGAS